MKKENKEIEESLNEIRKVMEEDPKKENKILENNSDVLLLKKIVSKSNVQYEKDEKFTKAKLAEKNTLKNTDTNLNAKKKNTKKVKTQKNLKRKNSDPIALMVEKEIKPIIKKWIKKNLRSFVKTIVVEEMKQISEATQKRTIK